MVAYLCLNFERRAKVGLIWNFESKFLAELTERYIQKLSSLFVKQSTTQSRLHCTSLNSTATLSATAKLGKFNAVVHCALLNHF